MVWIDTVLCNLVQIGAVWYNLEQFVARTWCSLVQRGAVWCNLVQHSADWVNFVLTGASSYTLV